MSLNPYEPPSAAPQSNEDLETRFVAARGRALLAMVCLGLFAVIALLSLGVKGVTLLSLMQVKDGFEVADASLLVATQSLVLIAQACAYLASVICFLVWLYRASRNVQALGAEGVKHSPGGAIGWWFVPIANLFKPYAVVKEIYQASKSSPDHPRRWGLKPVPDFFRWWWGCWLAGTIATRAVSRMGRGIATTDGFIALAWGEIVATVLMLVAAILAIFVVRAIERRQLAGYEVYADPRR